MKECIKCGKKSRYDVCALCLNEMKHADVRREIYDLRYSAYSTDHGKVVTDILKGFISPRKQILDIGCGAGHLSDFLYKNGMTVISIDFSQHMIISTKNNYSHLNPIIMSAEKLGFKDKSFDVVISYDLIEHLYDVKSHLKEVRRILKRGGFYIIKTPNKHIERLYNIFKHPDNKYRKAFHPSLQSHLSLNKISTITGFDVKFLPVRELSNTQMAKIKNEHIKTLAAFLVKHLPMGVLPTILCIATRH